VELNPVRARFCTGPEDWPWSSAWTHPAGADDELVSVRPMLELISDWARFIGEPDAPDIADLLHAHAGTGRPLGPDSFAEALEQRLRHLLKRKNARAEATATRLSHPRHRISCRNRIR